MLEKVYNFSLILTSPPTQVMSGQIFTALKGEELQGKPKTQQNKGLVNNTDLANCNRQPQ